MLKFHTPSSPFDLVCYQVGLLWLLSLTTSCVTLSLSLRHSMAARRVLISTASAAFAPASAGIVLRTPNLLDAPPSELRQSLLALGLPRFRYDQIIDGIFRRGITSFEALSQLSVVERASLSNAFSHMGLGVVDAVNLSSDGTRKLLLATAGDGPKVETVLIPGSSVPSSQTLCVSSQAGCSLRCGFCHTGTQAMEKNLSCADIVMQAVAAQSLLRTENTLVGAGAQPSILRNIVFMGQGEPLFNWRAVRSAIEWMIAGLGIPAHRITLSTAGVAPLIPRVATEAPGIRLAVSLHAGDDDTRSRIMDINARWPVRSVLEAVAEFVALRADTVRRGRLNGADAAAADDFVPREITANRRNGVTIPSMEGLDTHNSSSRVRVSFEYVMLAGVNDQPQRAVELAALFKRFLPLAAVHVNLIMFNHWPGAPFAGSPRVGVEEFKNALMSHGVMTTVRASRGVDVLGACGQLRSSSAGKTAAMVRKRPDSISSSSLPQSSGVCNSKPPGGPLLREILNEFA